jgi:hypothetical protein
MLRLPNIVATAFSIVIVTAAYAHAAPASSQVTIAQGETLTITSAKQRVTQQLEASGQRDLHPGKAEFDANGNVNVDLVSALGLTVGHVLVHANDGSITNAGAATKGSKG